MLRERLKDELTASMKKKTTRKTATLRLILAALKDRDISARSKGTNESVDDAEIQSMLQSMIKQRRESIAMYEKGGRLELAAQEAEEIAFIEAFLPQQLSLEETESAVQEVLEELEASTIKDMGPTMAALKARYAGRMDFSKASAMVKERLG